jgi:hypothetical protein
MKLLRTIRLDPSDTFVFGQAAEPGEWAVSGAFLFWNDEDKPLEGKALAAFRGGFLGIQSFGWSTLVQIVEAGPDDRRAAVETLADHLATRLGAPSREAAVAAAEEELDFASSLCTHPADTLIAVHRRQENGEILEAFRSLRAKPGEGRSLRALSFLVEEDEEQPSESVDLVALAQERRK